MTLVAEDAGTWVARAAEGRLVFADSSAAAAADGTPSDAGSVSSSFQMLGNVDVVVVDLTGEMEI